MSEDPPTVKLAARDREIGPSGPSHLIVRAHRLLVIRSLIVGQVVDGGHGVCLGKGGGCFEERS